MNDRYLNFLHTKNTKVQPSGFDLPEEALHPMLFPFQKFSVQWALRLGRAALFQECGMGKTMQQVEWAKHVAAHTGGKVLILAPLAVAHQTVAEGAKLGIHLEYHRSQETANASPAQILITNYEMLKAFDPTQFTGVVLDESSILKNFTGTTKRMILEAFETTPYKLACTATPAPNDHLELGNHAEFLGLMKSNEMISRWFINDTMSAGSYRLKRHAEKDFWRWVTSWAICLSKPSDIGFSDEGFELPPLHILENRIDVDHTRAHSQTDRDGQARLFLDAHLSATNMHREKRETTADRAARAAEIVASLPENEPVILWCDTNYEADELKRVLPDALEVRGSDSLKDKEARLSAFTEGTARLMITKADIAGFGLNWQHCAEQIFVGVSYSFERWYQAVRRSYRFRQTRPVNCHIIYAESEGSIIQTLKEKQTQFKEMQTKMNVAMRENYLDEQARRTRRGVETDVAKGQSWTLYLNDCVQAARNLPENSIDFSIFSPPFSNLYVYSDSIADMGNSADHGEFFQHFGYLIPELLRITVPGRLVAIHCKDLPLYLNRDGAMGLYDFPGEIRAAFENVELEDGSRWVYHSRVTIWKDPVIEMQRTKSHGLLHKELAKDSAGSRQGMADYMIMLRKWTPDAERPKPVHRHNPDVRFTSYVGEAGPSIAQEKDPRQYSIHVWQRYASPVWFDIQQTNVLNYMVARDSQDEKHICPLQLDVIERCIELWTNEGDTVFSPFAGIGSEGYIAVKKRRRFIGVELKRSYWEYAIKYLTEAEKASKQVDMFTLAAVQSPTYGATA